MVPQNVAEIIRSHVVLAVESIDRMYLNGYVPGLQTEGGLVHFVRTHLGYRIASTAVIAPMSEAFVRAIEGVGKAQQLDVVAIKTSARTRWPRRIWHAAPSPKGCCASAR